MIKVIFHNIKHFFLNRMKHFQNDYRKNLGFMTRQDNIPYNSCFYSSIEEHFDYVAILDIDEVRLQIFHA